MTELQKHFVQALCIVSLAGCGGGGGSSAAPIATTQTSQRTTSTAVTPATPPATTNEYTHSMPGGSVRFKSLPDVSVYDAVSQLELDHCTLSGIQHTITVDLNEDNQKDLLMFVLCGTPGAKFPGSDVEHGLPFRNTLMAVLSQPDGTYRVDNQSLFGTNDMQLGGEYGGIAGFFTPLEDPSSRLPHISYIISRDDHQRKTANDFSNMVSYQGVLSPNWEGTYNYVEFDEKPIWAQGVIGIPNNENSWDLLYTYWNADWRDTSVFVNKYSTEFEWVDISDQYEADEVKQHMAQQDYIQAFDTANHSPFGDTKPITVNYAVGGGAGNVTLYSLNNGFPEIVDTWVLHDHMEWHQWGSFDEPGCGPREIVVHDNKPLFGGIVWHHFELWWPTPDSDPKLFAFGATMTGADDSDYDPNKTYSCDDPMRGAEFRAVFELNNGELTMVENPFPVDVDYGAGVLKQTVDLNNDGYMDFFAVGGNGFETLPKVWINDKNGNLVPTSTDSLPNISEETVCDGNNICLTLEAESFLSDMNNDGIMDLVQWHTGTVAPDLHDWMYDAGVDASAFENKSGYINIWYGNE